MDKEDKSEKGLLSNMKVMDYILFICIFSIIVFVGVSLYQYYANGTPVSSIKTEFFAFFGVELLAMAGIAISNNINKRG